jgi:hypothetical protein
MHKHYWSGLLVCAFLGSVSHASQFPINVIARSGQQATGTAPGVTYTTFGVPTIGSSGLTSFQANLAGPGVNGLNDMGIWSGPSSTLSLVVRKADPAPGPPGDGYFSNLLPLSIATENGVCFRGAETTPSIANVGLWTQNSGGISRVARVGDAAPGTPSGVVYGPSVTTQFGYFGVNPNASLVYEGGVTGPGVTPGNNRAIWRGPAGGTELVVRVGDPVPGVAGAQFFNFGDLPARPAMNRNGQVAFYATADLTPGPSDFGVWLGIPGQIQAVAHSGLPVPGMPGTFFTGGSYPSINDSGLVSFNAGTSGAVQTGGIWRGNATSAELVAAAGQSAPGTGPGITFESRFGPGTINGQGRVVFLDTITGPGVTSSNDLGIWFGTASDLRLVARQGDAAPGTGPGVGLNDIFENPVTNALGQVAFYSTLRGPGVNGTNNFAIFATDENFQLQLVARESDLIEVNPGDFRTIETFSILADAGGEDGRPTALDNFGHLTFRAVFTDGSQAICVALIPEPGSSMSLLILTALCGAQWSHRHRAGST